MSLMEMERAERIRARVHGMWADVAGSWGEQADYVDARGAGVTERMLELTSPTTGERVLELACGPGGPGIAAAARVGAAGHVVLSDVVPEMAAIAASRAAARGLGNVSTRVLDLEQIDAPDSSYDVVLCREGLMFAVDPERAAREIARVLRPGGRVAVAVWGPRERNPWLGVLFDVVSAQLGKQVPPPGVPSPFSLDDRDLLVRVLRAAPLVDVAVDELPTPVRTRSLDEWWQRTRGLAGPLTALLAQLPEPSLEQLQEALWRALEQYVTEDGLEIPGLVLIASATR